MSRRDQIRMSDAEVRVYLDAAKTIIITSNGMGGYPHPMPMWFVLDDGSVRMSTFRASQKVKNIQRDPRVSLLVESGVEYAELRGVVIYGSAEIIEDLDTIKRTLVEASTRGGPPLGEDAREKMMAVMTKTAEKRVCIRIARERIVSWDHSKLGGTY